MNCEEYREAITADPRFADAAEHRVSCPACATLREQLLALDARIGEALALEVPPLKMPDLPEVDTEKVVTIGKPRLSAPGWLALAASVLVAGVLGVRMLGTGIEYGSLAEEVLAHVDHEPYAMRVTSERVSTEGLRRVVPDNVASFDPDEALITYAQTCVINGREVPHLVIQGVAGPVMILLMPEETVATPLPLSDEDSHGVILPVGDGSIAIVGSRNEPLGKLERVVKKSVMWST